ncbi:MULTISPECIES: hypothetical protein [unclassified Xanthomonas]|uniref:hypothetical protein n=1 Tax=unclassified Xanthomonas TaxID=2643310 RepID=UPI001AD96539|nr:MULTISPECIES: hypothetical protein [unclassified Xanthomonas]MBO9748871.1 hypothetical protein [Xanthomonas phaseoli pv. dieffenbachiae]MBO9879764.1 hypothetical protein [Xanthomonas sp. D-99]MBO9889965.1 hypothetical protein [Xanthomonas sp. D-36-1]
MKDLALMVLASWAFAAFVSLFIMGFYFLAAPWSWICALFLFVTPCGVLAYFVSEGL